MALSYPPCLNVNTWIVVGCGGGLVTPLEELALLLSWFGTAVEVPPLVRTLLHGN